LGQLGGEIDFESRPFRYNEPVKHSKSSRTRPVRVGVIGLGQIALKAHLPGYAKATGCQLTAIHSLREAHAKEVATQYLIPHIYKDWNRLLESDDVDAVSICTPNFTHVPIALKALREGKHVLVEKPMAMDRTGAMDLVKAAKKASLILMVHHNMRFDPAVRTAERLFRQKMIGDILAFRGILTHRGPQAWSPKADWFFDQAKSGGGALMDLGPHVFDSVAFLLGEPLMMAGAVAFRGKGGITKSNGTQSQTEIHCSCLLRVKSGAVGTLTVGWADTGYHNRYYFYGTKGTLSINLVKGDPITVEMRDQEGRLNPDLDKRSFSPTLYQHFIDCIRHGKKPWVSGEEGLRTVELIEAGYRLIQRPSITLI
jgi:UDP-N-acetylglucosamine 3-dehydrogenase